MNDEQLLRYSRQIMLPQIDAAGQERLLSSRALVVGMGGLGSPATLYLAAAGVGRLVLVDDDQVDLSNLQRQILHRHCDIGRSKVESARDTVVALNPDVEVVTVPRRLDGSALESAVAGVDVVVDGSDNFATRFAINAACIARNRPLVSGAAIRLEGQVGVFHPGAGGPCYRCLYREGEELQENCTQSGVLAPVVGVIGSMQALEVIKVLLGFGESLLGRLLLFDASSATWRSVRLPRDPACPACAGVGQP